MCTGFIIVVIGCTYMFFFHPRHVSMLDRALYTATATACTTVVIVQLCIHIHMLTLPGAPCLSRRLSDSYLLVCLAVSRAAYLSLAPLPPFRFPPPPPPSPSQHFEGNGRGGGGGGRRGRKGAEGGGRGRKGAEGGGRGRKGAEGAGWAAP